jgi:N-carbamoylputrescine amidase
MKDVVTVGLVQMTCGEDRVANVDKACAMAREARGAGADLIAFQELFASTYFCKTIDARHNSLAEPIPGPTTHRLAALAKELDAVVVGSVFERVLDGFYFNTAVVFERDGTLLGKSRKMHIPETGPGYLEKYYFCPGDTDYPVFDTSLVRLAVPTCWDQWFPEVARIAMLKGAELIIYPTAIGSEPAHPDVVTLEPWQAVQRGHAIANTLYVAAVNRVGEESGQTFYGHSLVVDPEGYVAAEAGDADEVLLARLERNRIKEVRELYQFLRDRRPETYAGLLKRSLID